MSSPGVLNPRIAIIGAGLGGATLASVLQNKGIAATVFDKETSGNSRGQGGTLDLHPESGQAALKVAGVYDDWRKIMRTEGQDFRLTDERGKFLIDEIANDDDETRPEVDRGALRDLFLNQLKDIRWGQQVKSVSKADDGYQLAFADGRTERFDLVLGADGTWSKVRPLLTDAVPEYVGVTFIEAYISNAAHNHPDISSFVGRGSNFILGNNKALMAQQNSNATIRVYVVLRVKETWYQECGIDWDNPAVAREKILQLFEEFSKESRDLIVNCDDSFWPRALYALPTGHRWPHRAGIVVLGDAAHVMSPFAGEGANLAMLDGAKLGLAIAEGLHSGELEKHLENWEKDMLERAEPASKESARNLAICISESGASGAAHAFGPPPQD